MTSAHGGKTMDLNYFICTLGQAARHANKSQSFTNINDFMEQQARQYGSLPAVGFCSPTKDMVQPWDTHILTFENVLKGTCIFAERLLQKIKVPEKDTVALLCPSSSKFLFTWLGGMRLGHPMLLIAPQCSASAIAQLCKQCNCTVLLFDDPYEELARAACRTSANIDWEVEMVPVPFTDDEALGVIEQEPVHAEGASKVAHSDIAYLHHTSGTSSGIPKPIPQTHHAGAGVYANFEGADQATFTTTPLFHGGIADLFRAWTSHSLIWLFPGKEAPITSANVVKCLEAAEDSTSPAIEFFSSVPYVLEMLAEDPRGTAHLQKMAVVGVGGAALPATVGDKLVAQNVNLVSRYGSAECGFLMSSYRDFANDREWQYLRLQRAENNLRFESREDGLSELIVLPGWPHMSKTNRDDGSFATSDLFQPHPGLEGAWKYHSRADSQLTLITGKKFDPSPLEATLTAAVATLNDVLVFGNGKPYPGALLFRSHRAKDMSDQELIDSVSETIRKINQDSQSHVRLAMTMLVPMPYSKRPLEKSSKGTTLRGNAEDRYASEIEKSYGQDLITEEDVSDDALPERVLEIVGTALANSSTEILDYETDLFAMGVDSLASIRIRHAVRQLLPASSQALPMTIVQDCGTVARLSQALLSIRKGRQVDIKDSMDVEQSMTHLVEQYSDFKNVLQSTRCPEEVSAAPQAAGRHKERHIVLTGSTGSLGSHLLHQLIQAGNIHVHLFVRGKSTHAARERVVKALRGRKLTIPSDFDNNITLHLVALSKSRLGLSQETWSELANKVEVIYHLAWSVDFLMPLKGFRQHFAGLHSLLSLAICHKPHSAHFIFCSSTAAVRASYIPERVVQDPEPSGTIGYSRSKWVAENLCMAASEQHPRLRVTVVRAGQLSGDSLLGIWNTSEGYPLILSSAKPTGCLPDLVGDDMRWVPVDVAAAAFVDLMRGCSKAQGGLDFCHLVNPNTETTWAEFCSWIKSETNVDLVPVNEWLRRLEDLAKVKNDHPCLKLTDFWRDAYGTPKLCATDCAEKTLVKAEYELTNTFGRMPSVAKMKRLDRTYALKLWTWIDENVSQA